MIGRLVRSYRYCGLDRCPHRYGGPGSGLGHLGAQLHFGRGAGCNGEPPAPAPAVFYHSGGHISARLCPCPLHAANVRDSSAPRCFSYSSWLLGPGRRPGGNEYPAHPRPGLLSRFASKSIAAYSTLPTPTPPLAPPWPLGPLVLLPAAPRPLSRPWLFPCASSHTRISPLLGPRASSPTPPIATAAWTTAHIATASRAAGSGISEPNCTSDEEQAATASPRPRTPPCSITPAAPSTPAPAPAPRYRRTCATLPRISAFPTAPGCLGRSGVPEATILTLCPAHPRPGPLFPSTAAICPPIHRRLFHPAEPSPASGPTPAPRSPVLLPAAPSASSPTPPTLVTPRRANAGLRLARHSGWAKAGQASP